MRSPVILLFSVLKTSVVNFIVRSDVCWNHGLGNVGFHLVPILGYGMCFDGNISFVSESFWPLAAMYGPTKEHFADFSEDDLVHAWTKR